MSARWVMSEIRVRVYPYSVKHSVAAFTSRSRVCSPRLFARFVGVVVCSRSPAAEYAASMPS
nr:hypothetical protein ISGA_09190 [Gordonia sp. NB41Y]